MIWCRFEEGSGGVYGLVDGDVVWPVDGSPLESYQPRGDVLDLGSLTLLPPVVPSVFFCAGLNYRAHWERAASSGYTKAVLPQRPEVGYRANNALVGHGAPIVKPRDYEGAFEAEGELVAVLGRQVRRCSRDEAQASVFGWTIGNDVSAREWQRSDRTLWRSKNADTFKPMGPWIVTDAEPLEATTTVAVNGEKVAEFPTGGMIFDPYDFICEISRYITLMPGDVLWMGADGTAAMSCGDVVDVSISGIGKLTNPVTEDDVA
jgi:2-keto-4-pentenoate hydratase/2-oxohepta-3-ene-1,7-dioic acid hydratase in catechol pathway